MDAILSILILGKVSKCNELSHSGQLRRNGGGNTSTGKCRIGNIGKAMWC